MPQDSGQDQKGGADAAARHLLEEIAAEPVPPKIVELAEKLDGLLAVSRKQARKTKD